MQRVGRAHKAHIAYLKHRESLADSDDDDGPEDEDAWLLEDLKVLTQLYSRLRDKEQIIALIFEVGFIVFGMCFGGCHWLMGWLLGRHCGIVKGYPHDILYASCSGVSSC
jgi:hypothetical protein